MMALSTRGPPKSAAVASMVVPGSNRIVRVLCIDPSVLLYSLGNHEPVRERIRPA